MSLTEQQQTFLNLICSRGGGKDIYELMEEGNMSYGDIERLYHEIRFKGYQLTALAIGKYNPGDRFSGFIKRIYLSPYDPKHDELVKNNGSVEE